jgi:hypothetical protein
MIEVFLNSVSSSENSSVKIVAGAGIVSQKKSHEEKEDPARYSVTVHCSLTISKSFSSSHARTQATISIKQNNFVGIPWQGENPAIFVRSGWES